MRHAIGIAGMTALVGGYTMTQAEFRNALCLIHSLDEWEIEGETPWYPQFAADPVRFFLHSDDNRAALIWRAMAQRMKGEDPAQKNE